jgi:hypothetical protein
MSWSDGDISPRELERIVALNVAEESAVGAILQELQGRFPEVSAELLRRRTQEWLEKGGRGGRIGFYVRHWPGGAMTELSGNEGLEWLGRKASWSAGAPDQLIAYEKMA